MKTEHIVLGVGGAVALYVGYNYYKEQQTQKDKKQQTQKEEQKVQSVPTQTQQTPQQNATTTQNKLAATVQSAKDVLDSVTTLLTNQQKQACLAKGGTWDGNGLFKKGTCTPKKEDVVPATRGTEPNHRTLQTPAYIDQSQLQAIKGFGNPYLTSDGRLL